MIYAGWASRRSDVAAAANQRQDPSERFVGTPRSRAAARQARARCLPRRNRPRDASCGPLAGRSGGKRPASRCREPPDSVRSRSVRGPAVAPIDTPAVNRENRPTKVETDRVATGARLAARQSLGARTRSVPPDFAVEQLLASETAAPSVRRCVADKPNVAIANTRDRVRPESSHWEDTRPHCRRGDRAVRHDRGDESRADRYRGDVRR